MKLTSLLGCLILAGCATTFEGSAHVPGGPSGCHQTCASWGMELTGMVAIGEFSDACICQPRAAVGATACGAAAASNAAVVAVETARRARAAAAGAQRP
jgi:hypothetical protein